MHVFLPAVAHSLHATPQQLNALHDYKSTLLTISPTVQHSGSAQIVRGMSRAIEVSTGTSIFRCFFKSSTVPSCSLITCFFCSITCFLFSQSCPLGQWALPATTSSDVPHSKWLSAQHNVVSKSSSDEQCVSQWHKTFPKIDQSLHPSLLELQSARSRSQAPQRLAVNTKHRVICRRDFNFGREGLRTGKVSPGS